MSYNPLFNVSSFLQTSNHHSPSSTSSSCSPNSVNSFSPNSSINAQCLPGSLNLNPSALLTSSSQSNQYLSNNSLSSFNSSFCSPSSSQSLLRSNSPNDQLSSLTQAQLAQMAAAAVVSINGTNNTALNSPVSNQNSLSNPLATSLTNSLTNSLSIKQAALAAALQSRANSSNHQILNNNNRLEHPQSSSLLSSQFNANNLTSKSFSPTKNFYYNSLKPNPFQTSNSPKLDIVNLPPPQTNLLNVQSNLHSNISSFTSLANSISSVSSEDLSEQLARNQTENANNSNDKVNARSSPLIQVTSIESNLDQNSKSKRLTNRQGKSVRKSNNKNKFDFSKVYSH